MLEKLVVSSAGKELPLVLDLKVSLPCSRELATGPYSDLQGFSLQFETVLRFISI